MHPIHVISQAHACVLACSRPPKVSCTCGYTHRHENSNLLSDLVWTHGAYGYRYGGDTPGYTQIFL